MALALSVANLQSMPPQRPHPVRHKQDQIPRATQAMALVKDKGKEMGRGASVEIFIFEGKTHV
jgi:hypothetical protein